MPWQGHAFATFACQTDAMTPATPGARPRHAASDEVDALLDFIVDRQADPATGTCYIGTEREALRLELEELGDAWPGSALVVTDGFGDVLEIGLERRYDLFDLRIRFPAPLVPRGLRIGLPKGSLEETTVRLFRKAGLNLHGKPRSYYLSADDAELEVMLIRAQEIPLYVADGTLDGYLDCTTDELGVWDYLGATLVCREAGGTVADVAGRGLTVLDHAARRIPVAGATAELAGRLAALHPSQVGLR